MAALLLAAGADACRGDDAGETPLLAAVVVHGTHARRGTQLVAQLLRAGARVNHRGATAGLGRHTTPLHAAAARGALALVAQLLAAGADATAADDRGRTPLHLAVALLGCPAQSGDTVRRLLRAGAAVDAEDHEGHSPLSLARARGDAALVALLAPRAAAARDDGGGDDGATATLGPPGLPQPTAGRPMEPSLARMVTAGKRGHPHLARTGSPYQGFHLHCHHHPATTAAAEALSDGARPAGAPHAGDGGEARLPRRPWHARGVRAVAREAWQEADEAKAGADAWARRYGGRQSAPPGDVANDGAAVEDAAHERRLGSGVGEAPRWGAEDPAWAAHGSAAAGEGTALAPLASDLFDREPSIAANSPAAGAQRAALWVESSHAALERPIHPDEDGGMEGEAPGRLWFYPAHPGAEEEYDTPRF